MTRRMSSGAPGDIFLRGPGEMAKLTREHDWATTPLGPIETWTASLRTTVGTLLASRHAMFLWWGPHLIQFYNDGYRPSLGPDRHPSALGARGRECWAEIWPIIGAEVESILAGGDATWHEDHLVPITRGDRVDDVYWSYSYSPVRDDDGSVGGVLVTVQETTRRVVAERRARLLQVLATAMLQVRTVDEVCAAAEKVVRGATDDVTYVRLHLGDGRPDVPADALTEPLVTGPAGVGGARAGHGVLVLGLNPRVRLDDAARLFAAQLAREIATALDAVERVALEQASAEATAIAERELLKSVFELAPAFFAVFRGPDHIFELANPAYERLVGHREILGRSVREALPEIERQGFVELLDRVYSTGEAFVGTEVLVELQQPAGAAPEGRYLDFVYQQMRRANGDVAGVLVTGTDVTALVEARRRVERSLAETERVALQRDVEHRQLRTVLEQAPLAIAIIGTSGEILFANPTFERLWGRTAENTTAETYSDAYVGYHLDGRAISSQEWAGARAVLRGETVDGEVVEIVQARGRHQTGQRLTVWISAAPVRDAEGAITGGVVMFRDITAERRTEQQLRDAQRLQAVGTLAGGVAHEVNNALQGVLGFGLFVLQALGPEHPQAADMRLVLQSAERAARVSQQLLAYTRQQVSRPQPVKLDALARSLLPVLQQLLGADKSLIVAATAASVPSIHADPAQIEQVLINLVANARDATDTGGTVTIGVDRYVAAPGDESATAEMGFQLAPGVYTRLTVSDTGHGMSGETMAHIFEPFFTTKPVGQGVGLGLSMVYGTVKQHGGHIGARSVEGRGTTMELYWPAVAESPSAAGPGESGTHAAQHAGHGRIVLVADDEPLLRKLITRTLGPRGYTVVAANDGTEAIEMIERGDVRPDLVITDVVMPRSNGRQLHDAVTSRWPDVPVLFISGHTGDEAVVQRLVPRGAPFLQKPFRPEVLARVVAELWAGAGR